MMFGCGFLNVSEPISINVAFWDYDRTAPLVDGRVPIKGCTPEFLLLRPQETFVRAFNAAEFDVCELSLSRHAQAVARGSSRYVGLPIFLSRCFRHSSIYVRNEIGRPEDLKNARVGVGNYDDTAAVVVRAILREEHGVDVSDVDWVVGDSEPPLRRSISIQQPPGISVRAAPNGRTLDDMLIAAELDAIIGLMPPPSFRAGNPRVKRLYSNWRAAEESWYRSRQIFPIMHMVGVRRELAGEHPWLLNSVHTAFHGAQKIALTNLSILQASKTMLPWLVSEYERTRELMGEDFWPYEVEPNRHVLDWTLRNLERDGLLARPVAADELFAAGLDF